MTYELCQQLKEAGFPQKLEGKSYVGEGLHKVGELHENDVYFPTLSELIEACGDDFSSLVRVNQNSDIHWMCPTRLGVLPVTTLTPHGSTPEEAVARLWLELNKK